MSNASSTDRAKVYRKAARLVDSDIEPFSCWAVDMAAGGSRTKARYDYTALFTPDGAEFLSTLAFDGEQDNDAGVKGRAHRVIALLTMAAMVEAGDA